MSDVPFDPHVHNQLAWDNEVRLRNAWTIPISHETVEWARRGRWALYLTPTRPVPRDWLPDLKGVETLCLAGGGGQQGPLLAAIGATVTVFDASASQLEQDRRTADREGLNIRLLQGDMSRLDALKDNSFDLIVHPPSNVYVKNVHPVWREAYRVLRPGGIMIAAFDNPVRHIFDTEMAERGVLRVRHRLPYSDLDNLTPLELRQRLRRQEPLQFGHLLEDQIGGQLSVGFLLTGFFEDRFGEDDVLSTFVPTFAVCRAIKPKLADH